MSLAIITAGFTAGSTSVSVSASVADGSMILLYDDDAVIELGTGEIEDGSTVITLAEPLFAGQRIIAYIDTPGTYKGVTVTDGETEKTGWKKPETVGEQTYEEYLNSGGAALPDVYDPENCRNISEDRDITSEILVLPIVFSLIRLESQAGTVQVYVEDIENAMGGAIIKFDSDAAGSTANKTYNTNGAYQVKVWGANQTEADAVIKQYVLTMPSAVTEFGTDIHDLAYRMDIANITTPGERPIDLVVYCAGSVVPQFQIDGEVTWTTGVLSQAFGSYREYKLAGQFLPTGQYTIRARRLSDGGDEISREINLVF